ncbi:GNAT family N-acetyltransferase/peptidase C39 family protein [Halobacteriovorax sp. XZX-3]|uniref:GNAT family N-acetyltransferase/peptidase C39 family protein n=1 Tax=unclassified Halobacteriovorax TaxID=2639665 RepID=UPI000CD1B81E|nr:GNAT family N-acetyltransferase/peptidase C39 family protein [Halobacteriovorax sp. DA5]POB15180.1 ribosomal-protein-alanine acetyltransferase [Halobacteriovorax sp. DA5]
MHIFRDATLEDLNALLAIEEESFDGDRLSATNFKYAITKSHGALKVILVNKVIAGYILVLFHRGTSLGRIYSIAISKGHQGQGLAKKLMLLAEKVGLEHSCSYLRLEVKRTNKGAISLYEKLGYKEFKIKHDYYEDHQDALCYEKRIRKAPLKAKRNIPYYQQTTDFTCGPSALMMALRFLRPKIKLNQELELDLWREATTIYMASGHGGCGPHGIALAAANRGLKTEIYINRKSSLFTDTVRDKKKKQVIELVQSNFEKKLKEVGVKTHFKNYGISKIREIIEGGGLALVLISAYRLTETKVPHWIVITNIDDEFIYFNDPDLKDNQDKVDNINIPVGIDEFEKMAKYGSGQLKCVISLFP